MKRWFTTNGFLLNLKQTFSISMAMLVLLTQTATVAVALIFAADQAERKATETLQVAGAVAESFMDVRRQQLANSVSILAKDFAFRQAVASQDVPTAESALFNHAMRINAHHAMLLDPDGRIIASMGDALEYDDTTWESLRRGSANLVTLQDLKGHVYQVELAPIQAPILIGWVTIGFRIDGPLAEQLHHITGTEVAFAANELSEPRILGGTQGLFTSFEDQTEESFSLSRTLNTTGLPLSLILWKPKDLALADFFALRSNALWISSISVLIALMVAVLMAKRITAHLSNLARSASEIAHGNYDTPIDDVYEGFGGSQEVKQLATTLDTMQTEIAERERKIIHQSTHDSLTGLYTQDAAVAALQEMIASKTLDFTVLVVVLRGLQDINSTFGLEVGDAALRTFASKLQSMDLLLTARLSHTRFLLVMNSSNRRSIKQSIADLMAELQLVSVNDEVKIRFDLYFGASVCGPTSDANSSIRQAWSASLIAVNKLEFIAWHEVDDSLLQHRRLTIMRDIRTAIDHDQFYLVYQPKYATDKQRYVGAEALLRWEHPSLGFVPVDEFIGIAEQTQDIRPLTRWVLRNAVEKTREWRASYPDFHIAVNITAHDLTDDTFVAFVRETLNQHNLPGTVLQVEVTERALVNDWKKAIAALESLDALGVTIAIDDYGTGFSSLLQLKELPAHILKIDKSFVMKLTHCEEDQHIVRSTIDLGHVLNMHVVAEGVEDLDAAELLTGWGCDYLQGYYLSKPVNVEKLLDVMAETPLADAKTGRLQQISP